MIILENVFAVVIWSLVSQVGPAVLSRRQKDSEAGGGEIGRWTLRVKWSNLEQQAPDSIPPPDHMLKMDLQLTASVPIDHSQITSDLAGEHFEIAVSVPFG